MSTSNACAGFITVLAAGAADPEIAPFKIFSGEVHNWFRHFPCIPFGQQQKTCERYSAHNE